MAGIDWSFIAQKGVEGESTHTTGYVPREGSGFTVGSVDIGKHSGGKSGDLWTMLQSYANKQSLTGIGSINEDLYNKLNPYTSRTNVSDIEARKVSFDKDEIDYITQAKRFSFEKSIRSKGGKDEEGNYMWDKISPRKKTILGSIGWQYGLNSPHFKALWDARDSKKEMIEKLNEWGGEEFEERRGIEVKHLNPSDEVTIMDQWTAEDNPFGFA